MIETLARRFLNILRIAAIGSVVVGLAACSHKKSASHEKLLASEVTTTIGVNAYLWRATLDTLDFMPVADVDSKGGVLVTDWYVNPNTPTERAKITVYILDKQLRADGIKVTVFRQRAENGVWVDQPDQDGAAAKIQDAILTQARYIRLETVPAN